MKKFLMIALALSALGIVMSGCSGGDAAKDETAPATTPDATKTSE